MQAHEQLLAAEPQQPGRALCISTYSLLAHVNGSSMSRKVTSDLTLPCVNIGYKELPSCRRMVCLCPVPYFLC